MGTNLKDKRSALRPFDNGSFTRVTYSPAAECIAAADNVLIAGTTATTFARDLK